MTRKTQPDLWALVRKQHGVIARRQLRALGLTNEAIDWRIKRRRLHSLYRGVYAVGRPDVTQEGRWMAAVLACGPGAALSHSSAAALWRIRDVGGIEVVTRGGRKRKGIAVHRREGGVESVLEQNIPVTTALDTVLDMAPRLKRRQLERMLDEADKLDLVSADEIREALAKSPMRPKLAELRLIIDRATWVPTRSELERMFVPLAHRAELPPPVPQSQVNGFQVDFYWPDLGLVVEVDGGRFHRTPAQQTRDVRRDQAHMRAGLRQLRFTYEQVRWEEDYVIETLGEVAAQPTRSAPV